MVSAVKIGKPADHVVYKSGVLWFSDVEFAKHSGTMWFGDSKPKLFALHFCMSK